ncbi:hypothetical protein [Naasia lichenicola]|uniref:hypothetical protein n=1 Tax=Naasia lichenicola TaxID=2565933 RepID=UPI00130D70B6|nr:hypothetical protein [Naasia lichenicola]
MTKRPADTSSGDTTADAVETDFSIPADADLRPSPASDSDEDAARNGSEDSE